MPSDAEWDIAEMLGCRPHEVRGEVRRLLDSLAWGRRQALAARARRAEARVEELEAEVARLIEGRSSRAVTAMRRAKNKALRGSAPGDSRFGKAISAATRRDKEWELSRDEYYDLVTRPCSYCGGDTGRGIGLDRIDNAKGYAVGNVVPACPPCNNARGRKPFDPDLTRWHAGG